ncbi:transposase [Streptomyces sp. NPDC056938]|uniref:transposase n=1 Tax=unclassified Streptomyces TaxID=2593676 RepID=UPI003635FD03
MPKPYPEEFREDVVRFARNRGPGVTIEQVAADFGVHAMTLWKWMRRADIDDGTKPGTTSQESAELREARRRIKLLEQENEVLRRAAAYLSQAHLPSGAMTNPHSRSSSWRAPPGRHEPRPLHGVWVDGGRDGSWGGWWVHERGQHTDRSRPTLSPRDL